MSIYCDSGYADDSDWYWTLPGGAVEFKPLDTKRARRCCSCKTLIKVGDDAARFERARPTNNDIEESIYGDNEVPLADWFMCETCGGLAMALEELGLCFTLGPDIRQQIREFNAEGAAL